MVKENEISRELYLTGFARGLEYAIIRKDNPEMIKAQYELAKKQLKELKKVV